MHALIIGMKRAVNISRSFRNVGLMRNSPQSRDVELISKAGARQEMAWDLLQMNIPSFPLFVLLLLWLTHYKQTCEAADRLAPETILAGHSALDIHAEDLL